MNRGTRVGFNVVREHVYFVAFGVARGQLHHVPAVAFPAPVIVNHESDFHAVSSATPRPSRLVSWNTDARSAKAFLRFHSRTI